MGCSRHGSRDRWVVGRESSGMKESENEYRVPVNWSGTVCGAAGRQERYSEEGCRRVEEALARGDDSLVLQVRANTRDRSGGRAYRDFKHE